MLELMNLMVEINKIRIMAYLPFAIVLIIIYLAIEIRKVNKK